MSESKRFFSLLVDFIEKSRLRHCENYACQENAEGNCVLKVIDLDESGKCAWFTNE